MRIFVFVFTFTCCIGNVFGQTESRDDWTPEQWTTYFKSEASDFKITEKRNEQVLEFHAQPLLNWTNPLNHQGLVFYWTLNGRPEVIGSLFKYVVGKNAREKHAMHSLSVRPLRAEFRGKTVWTPKEPGLTWFEPKSERISANAKSQQLEMRSISRLYKVSMTEKDGSVSELRLLPKPLLEYASPANKVAKGAVFAYATATDPDAMLVVELIDDSGKQRLQCGFARSHYLALRAVDDSGMEVWSVPFDDMSQNPAGSSVHIAKPYCSYSP